MNIAVTIIISILAIGVAVVLHEVMHGYVAKYLGDDTAENEGRLTLNPVAHIDPIFTLALPLILIIMGLPAFGAAKPVPVQGHKLKGGEFGMALVAFMGPMTNLTLAIIGSIILNAININSELWDAWWVYFISINIGFFIFNLIPFPPLDGSRVLYAFAPSGVQNIMEKLEPYGIFIIFGSILLFGTAFLTPVYSLITSILIP
jgi:Zn-dependent protease